jgi:hypothetical protein
MLWSPSLGMAGFATGHGYRPACIILCKMDVFFSPPSCLAVNCLVSFPSPEIALVAVSDSSVTLFQDDFALLGTVKPS